MAVTVLIGQYSVWLIGSKSTKPTVEGILGFTQRMIATEAQYMVERTLFPTHEFIDFGKMLQSPATNHQDLYILDKFLFNESFVSPRFAGFVEIKYNINTNRTLSTFVFKNENNLKINYKCFLDDPVGCESNLLNISNSIWNNKDFALETPQTNTYFMDNSIVEHSETAIGGSIWFITWKSFNDSNNKGNLFVIGAMVRSFRITEEFMSLQPSLPSGSTMYFMSNDKYHDVFATSIGDQFYIQQHDAVNSSINLDSTFGYTRNNKYNESALDTRIQNIVNLISVSNISNDSFNYLDDYFIYYRLQYASFGTFYTIIIFPQFDENTESVIMIIFSLIATILAIINACLSNAVPLVPSDSSWLQTALFTDEDEKEINDIMKIGSQLEVLHDSNHRDKILNKQSKDMNRPLLSDFQSGKNNLNFINLYEKHISDISRSDSHGSIHDVLTSTQSKNALKQRKQAMELKFSFWKKEQQKRQLKRDMIHVTETKYKTTYAQHTGTLINVLAMLIMMCVVLSYLWLRTFTEGNMELLMQQYLNVSSVISQKHVEFRVYQSKFALQQLSIIMNSHHKTIDANQVVLDLYSISDGLTGMFTFTGNKKRQITNLSIYGSVNKTCMYPYEIQSSHFPVCIVWQKCNQTHDDITTLYIRDCTLYSAIQETYQYFVAEENVIVWSIPFTCFGGNKICYVALTNAVGSSVYTGILLSMNGISDIVEDIVWTGSGMKNVVHTKEINTPTAYTSHHVIFSFYLFTRLSDVSFLANKYGLNDDYLLAATNNKVITTIQTPYSETISSIMPVNNSENTEVQRTYQYLYELNLIQKKNNSSIVHSAWGYPKIVYFWYENAESLNWVSVITISSTIFLGDHIVYSTLGSFFVIGWVIMYLFLHFVSYRRFQHNIESWEELYLHQIEKQMFPLLDPDVDEDNEHVSITPIQLKQLEKVDKNINDDSQDQITDFISTVIRESVRRACKQSWIRQQRFMIDIRESALPTKRNDVTKHYLGRALRHIYQAKKGMNIITAVQMEQCSESKEYRLKLYNLQCSRIWRWFMQIIISMHLLLVFWRPLTEEETLQNGYPKIPLFVECCCLLFQLMDIVLLGFIQFRWQDVSKNPLISLSKQKTIYLSRFLVWLLVVIDVMLLTVFQTSFTRYIPIRPWLLILSNDKLIGACHALSVTARDAADAWLLFIILLAIGSLTGVILFRFEDLMDAYNVYSFQNWIRSIFSTYIFIISGENYSDLVYVSFANNPFFILYFISLTIFGTWIVVSLIVSRFQTSFKNIYRLERQRREYFFQTGYVAAFSLINLDDDNQISKATFQSFLNYMKDETNTVSFDHNINDVIDIGEFIAKLEQIYQTTKVIDIIHDGESIISWILLNIVETESFAQFVLVIMLVEIIIFALFGIYPGTQNTRMLDLVLGVTVLLNGLDIIVKLASMGWDYYWNVSRCRIVYKGSSYDIPNAHDSLVLKEREFAHRFDLIVVVSAVIFLMISRISVGQLWFTDETNTTRVVMIIPLFRLFTLIKTTRSAVYFLAKIIPRFTSLTIILILLFYLYGVIGVSLIGDKFSLQINKPQYSFATFSDSLLTLYQLTLGSGWHHVMYSAAQVSNSLLLYTWYFLSW
eukprot:1324_1